MSYPVYDRTVLPCPQRVATNTHESPMAGLGYRAFTGKQYVEIHVKTVDQANAVYSFWLNPCKHGLKPFMMALNYMGNEPEKDSNNVLIPNYLVRFQDHFIQSSEKLWKAKLKLKIVGAIDYITDDALEKITDDALEEIYADTQTNRKEINYE